MADADLTVVLGWRNQPEIRANMYTNHEISLEEHLAWWKRTRTDASKRYFICESKSDGPVGVVSFNDYTPHAGTAFWAFYSGDRNRRGVGSFMEGWALNYAFSELGLVKLSCEVLSTNRPVIEFHRKFGFRVEGIFRDQHFDGKDRCDIYRLALTKNDWMIRERGDGGGWQGRTFSQRARFSQKQVVEFAALTGDQNPLHVDPEAAVRMGFKGTICHGVLSASLFSKILATDFPGPGTIYLGQTLRFAAPVLPDTDLVVDFKVVSQVGRRLSIETLLRDAQGSLLIEGEAEVMLPKAGTKI
jgi:UDP-4-amino-4,6-dideoxy-N-acetyl-beta-L-altrosamine N-acetyltransferase